MSHRATGCLQYAAAKISRLWPVLNSLPAAELMRRRDTTGIEQDRVPGSLFLGPTLLDPDVVHPRFSLDSRFFGQLTANQRSTGAKFCVGARTPRSRKALSPPAEDQTHRLASKSSKLAFGEQRITSKNMAGRSRGCCSGYEHGRSVLAAIKREEACPAQQRCLSNSQRLGCKTINLQKSKVMNSDSRIRPGNLCQPA